MSLDLKDSNTKYVKATCNYQYSYKGEDICMAKDEVYLLLKTATEDWWQVIRDGDKKAFFAPRQYLEVTDVSVDIMKSSLRKKKTHQRHLQYQQRFLEENRKKVREKDEKISDESFNNKISDKLNPVPEYSAENLNENCSSVLNPSFWQKLERNSEKTLLDANRNEASMDYANSSSLSSSPVPPIINFTEDTFVTYGDKAEFYSSSSNVLPADFNVGNFVNKRSSMSNPLEKLSASSELDYSSSAHTSISSLNDTSKGSIDSFTRVKMNCHMVGKAASYDPLQDDDHLGALDIKHAKAASSEELDRRNKSREYLFQSDRLSHRNRSNSVDLKRFDNNLDLSESEKLTSLEKIRKCRISRDPMNRRRSWALNDSHSISSYYRSYDEQDSAVILDIPPKLPPKLRKSSHNLLSKSTDNLQKLMGPLDLKIEEVKQNLHSIEAPISKEFPEPLRGSQESLRSLTSTLNVQKPIAKPRRTLPPSTIYRAPEVQTDDLDINKQYNSSCSLERLSGWERVRSIVEREKDLLKQSSYKVKDEINNEFQKTTKEKSVEELIEKIESNAKATDSKGKAFIQSPPSPTDPPRRVVFDDWGEYIDKDSGRPYYYNSKTNEKRWKPPRKSICSTVISEVTQNPGIISKEAFSQSVKGLKIPTPPQAPLWPFRERSFTSLGTTTVPVMITPKSVLGSTNSSSTLSINSPLNIGSIKKGSSTLPNQTITPEKDTSGSPTHKASKSFFSSISSFMKHTSSGNNSNNSSLAVNTNYVNLSVTPPQVPPSNTKPPLANVSSSCPTSPVLSESSMKDGCEEPPLVSLQSAIEQFPMPKNWIRKYDALSQQIYFQSLVTGEKWNPAIDKSGTVYVYSPNSGESKWNLQEYESCSPTTPPSPFEVLDKFDAPVKEDVMLWRFNLRRGKKVKKSWSKSYVTYYPNSKQSNLGKTIGFITFSKKPKELKKYDHFDLIPPCYIDSNLKKLNTICLHNGDGSEILLQADSAVISTEWTKLLIDKEKLQEKSLSPDKEKRATKSTDKAITKKDSFDELDTNKGIKDTLMLFFKKRIQQETLQKKGIYKDAVFGSTISDLCQKEQLHIPMFVLQCLRNIEKNEENFKVDGLYRISGNASKIQKIRIEIAQNRYGILEEEKDVHNLTGSLKLFFRELKEPLVPFLNYQSFIEATGSEFLKNTSRSEALRQAVKKIPLCNRETIKILLRHLLKVNEYEQDNRMSIMNLAIVFGPCLMWPETASGYDLMTDAMLHNRVVEGLLLDFEDVFKCSR